MWGFDVTVGLLLAAAIDIRLLVLAIVYPVQIIRIAARKGIKDSSSWVYGFFVMLGKFPELQGQVKFLFCKWFKSPTYSRFWYMR